MAQKFGRKGIVEGISGIFISIASQFNQSRRRLVLDPWYFVSISVSPTSQAQLDVCTR
jgi:hypothetical protein